MPPPARGGRSAQRRTTPQSPLKSAASATSPKQTRRSARSASRELEPVPRQQNIDPDLEPVVEEHNSLELGTSDSIIDGSISEFTTGTQNELQNLNIDDILEALPDLKDGAQKLINFFNRDDNQFDQFLQDLSSSTAASRTFQRRMQFFLESRAAFSTNVFITPEVINRKLQGPSSADETWKPDAVLYMANVAVFLATVVTGDADRKDEIYQAIYSQYPATFMPSDPQSMFGTSLLADAISFGNSFRTQFFILLAEQRKSDRSFDPDSVLRDLFMNGDDLSLRGVSMVDPSQQYDEEVRERMQNIKSFFTTDPRRPVKLAELRKAFPLNGYLREAVRWCNLRSKELEAIIDEQNGADGIVDRLSRIIEGTEIVLDEELVMPAVHIPAPRGAQELKKGWGKNNANLSRFKNINNELAARITESDAASQSQSQSILGDEDEPMVDINHDDDLDLPLDTNADQVAELLTTEQDVPPSTAPALYAQLALIRESEATKAKRSFNDPQIGAQRLNFDEDTQQTPARGKGKRHAATEPDDDEFETDTRQTAKRTRVVISDNIDPALTNHELPEWAPTEQIPTQAAMLPPTPPVNRSRQQTKQRSRLSNSAGAGPSSSAPPAAQISRSPMSSPATDSRSELDASQAFQRVRQLAKDATRRSKLPPSTMPELHERNVEDGDDAPAFTQRAERAAMNPAYQERRPWTQQEETRLIDFIGVFGPAYSRILKEDHEDADPELRDSLAGRNQVQLKDKARNIKFAYLKSEQPLPVGFGPVSIGKVMVKKLADMGIEVEGDGRERGI